MCHRDFIIAAARLLCLGDAMPWSNWRLVLLTAPPASKLARYAAAAPALPEELVINAWSIQPYVEGPPELLPHAEISDPMPAVWTNETAGPVTIGAVAVIADREAGAGSIAVSGANWTDATRRLTAVGAFASYIWKSGDLITLTAGTGVIAGQYEIAARISDDEIELAADITADNTDVVDDSVAGAISNGDLLMWEPVAKALSPGDTFSLNSLKFSLEAPIGG